MKAAFCKNATLIYFDVTKSLVGTSPVELAALPTEDEKPVYIHAELLQTSIVDSYTSNAKLSPLFGASGIVRWDPGPPGRPKKYYVLQSCTFFVRLIPDCSLNMADHLNEWIASCVWQ